MKNNPELPSYPPIWFVRLSQKIRHFSIKINRRFTHPNVVLWEMAQNMWLAAGISVAAELGIADQVKEGPVSIEHLAVRTRTHRESLYRVLRMLASHGIFKERSGQRFEITPLAVPLQEDQIRYMILIHLNRDQFQIFGELLESVRSGKTVSAALTGKALFNSIGNDERKNEWFNKAMSSASKMQIPALLSAFPYKRYGTIIDIGGGEGLFLASILNRVKKSKGVLFDLPAVTSRNRSIAASSYLEGRLEVLGGNFFEQVPEGGELYILKSVLHDWDDDASRVILGNVHRAMDPKARLLIIDSVLDDGNHPSYGKMTDILMMVTAGGKERTLRQWEQLLTSSSFKIRKIHPTITSHSIIELLKI